MAQVVTTPTCALLPFFMEGGVDSELSAARSAHVRKASGMLTKVSLGSQFRSQVRFAVGRVCTAQSLACSLLHLQKPVSSQRSL